MSSLPEQFRLSVFLRAEERFELSRELPTGRSPNSLVASDFNSDGAVDLVAANVDFDSLSLFLAQGSGAFQNEQPLTTGSRPFVVLAGDLDRDGAMDIVSAGNSRPSDQQQLSELTVFRGRGDGTFEEAQRFPRNGTVISLALADLDGDNILDLVASQVLFLGFDSQLLLLKGNGDGTFGGLSQISTPSTLRSVVATDLDADGFVDLVAADNENDRLAIFQGAGGGVLIPRSPVLTGNNPTSVAIEDLNGDGHLD